MTTTCEDMAASTCVISARERNQMPGVAEALYRGKQERTCGLCSLYWAESRCLF